jgi:hypothetical protein
VCGRCSDILKFELEIKSKFPWKMKSCEIQRLEFVSDKIEARDSRRNVVRIRFGQPPKKNGLGWGFPCMGVVMAGLRAPWLAMGACREGKEGEGRRGAGGTANSCGLWRGGRGRHGEAAGGARSLYTSVLPCFSVASMRKRKREEKKKGKANKRKSRKRNGKKFQT